MSAALLPVFLVILLGHALRRFGFPGDTFWMQAERLTYYLFFPALLMDKLATADFSGLGAMRMGLALAASVAAISVLLLIIRRKLPFDGPAYSSVFQGGVRMNTYVGLAGAAALFGDAALPLCAVAMVAMIPVNNLFCVPVVSRFGGATNGRGLGVLLELGKNPLILGCIAGFAMNVLNPPLPAGALDSLTVLGRAALPLGLLAVGAGLEFGELRRNLLALATSSAAKLVIFPIITATACALLDVTGTARATAIIFTALPTASSSYILARQLGGDAPLMAAIITGQTIISAATLPVMLALIG
ncbi:hypothetical protein GGQ74_001273 [Desulfobaculum xiamenense]|uniref:Permease n=1 Tax=Desulfobaculum xiamenense TaxID=995050 RepID=A0A846QN04_9BACT|nr:AEC family transporter [Desulfobaculum xiamenense]NJB67633.1 hypothetical protein [Desulfobaculum xiamenense]